jgi:bestrophin-3
VFELQKWTVIIPIQFLLGFYVHTVFSRWWDSFQCITFPDQFLSIVCVHLAVGGQLLHKYTRAPIQGDDEYKLTLRRTLYRLINLQCVMVWREVALKVKRRFPTIDHVVGSGLMTEHEHTMYNRVPGKWWLPTMWIQNLIIKWVVVMGETRAQLIQTIRRRCYQ